MQSSFPMIWPRVDGLTALEDLITGELISSATLRTHLVGQIFEYLLISSLPNRTNFNTAF
eukprot:6205376-Pleurochrysis_carterae.AAC.1